MLPHVAYNCYQPMDRQIHEALYQNQTLHVSQTVMVKIIKKGSFSECRVSEFLSGSTFKLCICANEVSHVE